MRLSEWRAAAPARAAVDPKVLAVVEPVLDALGAGRDPHCWAVWGDDVTARWQLLVPTGPGLLVTFVRVNVPGEGPRASAKLVRWSRVQVGELAIETQGGHRILSFSVENTILKGVDAEADRVAGFALGLIRAIDGRVADVEGAFGDEGGRSRRGAARGSGTGTGRGRAAAPGKGAGTRTSRATVDGSRGPAAKAGGREARAAGSATTPPAIPASTGGGRRGSARSTQPRTRPG